MRKAACAAGWLAALALVGCVAPTGHPYEIDEARTRIASVGEGDPVDPVVALDRGRIAALRAVASGSAADGATARRLLERAVALAPESAAAHAALARELARSGERAEAIAAFQRARDLGAWSPPLDLALARLYRDAGARKPAIALLRPLAADLHRGDLAEHAKRLLEEMESER